ncbi:hypothetical protein GCM10028807_32020 [Spirosoma daeguense]
MNSINILFIAFGDQTGANTALIKLAEALHKKGHNVQVLVRDKTEYNPIVNQLPSRKNFVAELGLVVDESGNKIRIKRDEKYLFNSINEENSFQDTDIILSYLRYNPHIIFVGITFDFLTSTDILKLATATKATVYNVAVDMNHFTGGCHFAWNCEGYKKGCDTVDCPAILEDKYKQLAARNFRIKKNNIQKGDFKILAGTEWTHKQARESFLYKDQSNFFNISGVVDTDIFNPEKRDIAKKIFNLDNNKFYILAGSENTFDERKGYVYFVKAINLFWDKLTPDKRKKVEILSVTKILDNKTYDAINFSKKLIPFVKDERLLALLYQAADVYVNSSLEDSGPSMLIEAMACGTPVVSFDMGAGREFVSNGKTGYVVNNRDAEALAESLLKVFDATPAHRLNMGTNGHTLVLEKGSIIKALETVETIFALEIAQKNFIQNIKSISVALCTYNGERYISEQLDSIIYQNLRPDEIIICDDNSTDDTLKILNVYKSKFPELIKIHTNETRIGFVKNFEKAINLCSKEIIFLSDQDDIWFPHKTETILRLFNSMPHIEAISHNLQICTDTKELTDITMWDTIGFLYFLKQTYGNKDYLFHSIFFGNMVTGASFCIKKSANRIAFHNDIPHVIHDYQMAIDYLLKDSIYFHEECLGLYRQHNSQQIGAVLDKVIQHTRAIKMYYELNNPLWNLLYIRSRMKTETVFQYLKIAQNVKIDKLIKHRINKNIVNLFKPLNWKSQFVYIVKIIFGKMKMFFVGIRE